jgi:16S rRNA processing protein RimM
MENYLSIGKLAATFGVKGEVVLEHHLGEDASLEGVVAIFIEEFTGKFIPYFIGGSKTKSGTEMILHLEGIDSPESAKRFLRKKIWLKEEDVKKTASATAPISMLGFMVYDNKKPLSVVLEVIEQPVQILLRIELQGKEVLVPLNESTLDKIDHKQGKIFVTLPDGLLDIYLL